MAKDDMRDDDDSIWEDAETLSPSETKDSKIHLTLRLDPVLYRAVVREKKKRQDRTVTATVEWLLQEGLNHKKFDSQLEIIQQMRNMIVHGIAQDAILVLLARNLNLDAGAKPLIEALQERFENLPSFKQWLSSGVENPPISDKSAGEQLIRAICDPHALDPAS
jgi:hypothetical protein